MKKEILILFCCLQMPVLYASQDLNSSGCSFFAGSIPSLVASSGTSQDKRQSLFRNESDGEQSPMPKPAVDNINYDVAQEDNDENGTIFSYREVSQEVKFAQWYYVDGKWQRGAFFDGEFVPLYKDVQNRGEFLSSGCNSRSASRALSNLEVPEEQDDKGKVALTTETGSVSSDDEVHDRAVKAAQLALQKEIRDAILSSRSSGKIRTREQSNEGLSGATTLDLSTGSWE